mmetsp:Transcript_35347/g.39420  ORF Transcript_35347/g.39420 Transcript_35347/m.39420 type:complete len:597 (-) Transcript_35347:115-1905(-)
MKLSLMASFSLAMASLLLPLVQGYGSRWEAQYLEEKELSTTSKMWIFAQDGIHIFSADGTELALRGDKRDYCDNIEDPWDVPGTMQNDCWYIDAVHDGENYVFVTNGDWIEQSFVDVFSMWTGTKLASIPVCTSAYHLEYAPNRRELWVQCWLRPYCDHANITDFGNVEVLSTQSIGAPSTKIDIHGIDEHAHGNILVDTSIPNKAYEFTMSGPSFFEVDASSKRVLNEIQVEKTLGTYEIAYSAMNRHIFIRNYGCCSCGESKDTRGVCNEMYMEDDGVIVEYGPNASPERQDGYCGKFCRGSLADINGLWEFDTTTNAFITQHFPANGGHGAKPFSTPKGDFILIGSGDGGNAVKVLKPGKNGVASVEVGVIKLEFGADIGTHAFSDVEFIEDENRNIAVFTSILNNFVVLVDLNDLNDATDSSPVTISGSNVDLFETEQDDVSVEYDIRGINIRKVRWARGTNYVWIDSAVTEQVHVIDIGKNIKNAKVVRTIGDIELTRQMLWVHNFEEDSLHAQQKEIDERLQTFENRSDDNNDNTNTLAIVGVILGVVALVIGLANLLVGRKDADHKKNQAPVSDQPPKNAATQENEQLT